MNDNDNRVHLFDAVYWAAFSFVLSTPLLHLLRDHAPEGDILILLTTDIIFHERSLP
jgi:hypothetical protein